MIKSNTKRFRTSALKCFVWNGYSCMNKKKQQHIIIYTYNVMTIIINHTHVDQRKRAIFWCFGFHFSTIPRVLYPDKEPVYASQPAMARSSRLQARECGSERRSWQHGMHLGVLNEWSYIYICHYFIWKVFPQAAIYQMSFLYRYIGLYSNTYIYI